MNNLKASEENRRLIGQLLKNYNLVYRVNLSDASFELMKVDDGMVGTDGDFADFTRARDFFIDNIACEDDREMLRRELDLASIRSRMEKEARFSTEYRAVLNGVSVWHEMVVSSLGDDEVAIGFAMRDAEILNRHISQTVMDTYDAIYVVNLLTDQMKVLKASGIMLNRPEVVPFSRMMREFVSGLDEDARKYFETVTDPENGRELLKKEGRAEYYYRSPYYGDEPVLLKSEIHVLTWDKDLPATAVIGISKADAMQREKVELSAKLSKALDAVTEERNRFAVAAELINSANWSFTIDENDEVTDARFFGEPIKILGIDLEVSPHAWETIVHPDDREAALKAFNAAIRDHSGNTPYDVQYRMRDRDGNYNWFRSAGKVLQQPDGSREFFGIHININDRVEEQERRRREVENAEKLIESVASVYRFAFSVDMENGDFRLIRIDDEVKRRLRTTNFESYKDAVNPIFGMLHPADVGRMRRELSFDTIREKIRDTVAYNVEYRVISDGATCWHEMNVTYISGGKVAMGFGEKDLEITKRHLEDKRYAEYFTLGEVDIDRDTIKLLKVSPYYGRGEVGKAAPYTAAMQRFAATQSGDAKEFFLQLSDLEYVKKELAYEGKHTFSYRSDNVGGSRWVDCTSYVTCRHEDGTPSMFSLGFSFIDSFGAARQELQSKLAEQKKLLQDALDAANSEAQRNDFLFESFNARKWTYEISADDEVIGVSYAESTVDMFAGKYTGDPMNWVNYLHPDDRRRAEAQFMAAIYDRSGRTPYDVTFRVKGKDGKYRWTKSAGKVFRRADGTGEFFGMNLDITEQIETQEKQQQKLQEALDMAQSANRAKTEFLFNMSHDIRTPMNAILGFTGMAKKHIDDRERVEDCLEKTQQSGNLLLSLINSVLDMSRIESGSAESEEKAGDVYYSFANIESTMLEAAASKNIALSFEFGEITDRYVYADFTRCLRVFTNLISNAIKYTKEGGFVKVRCEQAGPAKKGTASFRYTIEDNGIGMSEQFRRHMFEPFTREYNSTTSGIQGTGLGLSVCKSFVDYLHGTIECESRQGLGTKFTVTLPFRLQEGETYTDPLTGALRSAGEWEPETEDFRGRKVLLVEDNELNLDIATDILEEEGLNVETAENGQAAVRTMREKGPDYYDFILMDIQMPVMNGYEATKAIRDMYPDRHIPIIALSANAFAEDRAASIAAGMDDHVAKPINVKELFSALARFL